MSEDIKPLQLIPDKNVKVTFDDIHKEIADVRIEKSRGVPRYEIRINRKIAKTVFDASWLKKIVKLEQFISGLLLHEICHIKYGAFDYELPIDNPYIHTIHNILLDSQGEAKLSAEHPALAWYLRILLNIVRRDVHLQTIREEKDRFEGRIRDLFYLARFGVVVSDADEDFINFALPLVLSSTRGDVKNVVSSTLSIYHYLYQQMSTQTRESLGGAVSKNSAIGDNEISAIDEAESVSASENVKSAMQQQQQDNSSKPGSDSPPLVIEDRDNAFFRQVIATRYNEIKRIRDAFKVRLDKLAKVYAYDGDLSINKQQQAYIDSFSVEEGPNYEIFKRKDTHLDVTIYRDVSGSTSGVKEKYATLTVMLLVALHGLPGIRVAEIDFNTNAAVLLNFDEPIMQSRLYPTAAGGTDIVPAYKLSQGFKWRARKKIGVVITDGDFEGGYLEKEAELAKQGIHISRWNVAGHNANTRTTSFETFHVDIAKWLLSLL